MPDCRMVKPSIGRAAWVYVVLSQHFTWTCCLLTISDFRNF